MSAWHSGTGGRSAAQRLPDPCAGTVFLRRGPPEAHSIRLRIAVHCCLVEDCRLELLSLPLHSSGAGRIAACGSRPARCLLLNWPTSGGPLMHTV